MPNSLNINAKTGNEKDQEIIKNHVSMNGKIIQIHCKNNCFGRFSRLRAQTVKGIKQPSKMKSKSIPKSMNNRYKFHARKRDTQNMKIHSKSYQKKK